VKNFLSSVPIRISLCILYILSYLPYRVLMSVGRGLGILVYVICWWWSDERLRTIVHIDGLEHIKDGFDNGKGIILLSAHFTTLEIGGRLLGLEQKVNAVYRKHTTPYFEAFVKNKRAPTNPATARLAKLTGAIVVPFTQYRRTDGSGYDLKIFPHLKNFPSGDDLADANLINQTFENFIREQVSHYYWVHRRFKRLPEGFENVYADV